MEDEKEGHSTKLILIVAVVLLLLVMAALACCKISGECARAEEITHWTSVLLPLPEPPKRVSGADKEE